MKVVLISDTHGYLDPAIESYARRADEIWHAGDIGSPDVMDGLREWAPVRTVFGNIDDHLLRTEHPEYWVEEFFGHRFLMIHIAGPVGRYNPKVRNLIREHRPGFLICGHSHILKVVYDHKFDFLYVNPGAVGHHGFHQMRTLITFEIGEKVYNMNAVELGRRGFNL